MGREGYIKVWRRLFEHPIWLNSTPEQKCVLVALLEMVNHQQKKWEWKGETFDVDRGQVVTSLASIRDECGKGVTTQNVRTALTRFEKLGFLTNESTKTGRLITIENYSKWQDSEVKTNKDANKDLTKTQQRANKDLTPNKNDKNNKNIYIEPKALNDAVIAFIDFRKKIKKPMTDRAIELLLKKLMGLSSDTAEQIEILEQSIVNGWTSIYPVKQEDAKETVQQRKKYG